MLDVSVNGDDVTGVRLVGIKPVAAAGRIILEGSARQSLQPSTLRVSSFPAPVNGVFGTIGQLPSPAIVNDDFTFEAKARPYVEPGDATDPELLDRVRPKATAFSLGDGETKTVDLKLSAAQ